MSRVSINNRLGNILLNHGWISNSQLELALSQGRGRIGERLISFGAITDHQLAQALAEQLNIPYVPLDSMVITPEIFSLLPARLAFEWNALPYGRAGNILEVVISDPLDITLISNIEHATGLRIKLLISTEQAIRDVLSRSEGSADILRDASEGFLAELIIEDDDGSTRRAELADEHSNVPVVRLVNTVIHTALQKRASDIHIQNTATGLYAKYRIDGVLQPATEMLDPQHHSSLVTRLKVMAELDIAERRIPQDGRFKLRINGQNIDFRVSILPGVFGEDVVIRVLDKRQVMGDAVALSLEQLDIDVETDRRFRRALREPHGMVLITGPTGSGKTTTLYAALSEINNGQEKIITIEDPVEYQIDGILQIPVNEKKELTFARGLRSILRHDPDKIMVGEIRDAETARIAIQSALTGHLVFSTVHANSSFDVIGRFNNLGIDAYSLASAINCVLTQRLVRKICHNCKNVDAESNGYEELSDTECSRYSNVEWKIGAGCSRCGGTGYSGRMVIIELLSITSRLRDLIAEGRPVSELERCAEEEGMVSLRQAALSKALDGHTSLREVNRVIFRDWMSHTHEKR
ncbi:MAG: Flp pilus assembly complex ATPase component TadA [Candidatus Thiodiazotropha sp. (ex Lucinoma borealis)]|nr:Flp pilus assembly complex ATPase component TadA [Candidatus Thiodiazotropha sp. (ex Lucinoma borealis)]MCU7866770.1 Flp pilus assembly complex ATPase component TadA [Candidatus Thiodiazotropha sp. (ex Lucinoma borealis)]